MGVFLVVGAPVKTHLTTPTFQDGVVHVDELPAVDGLPTKTLDGLQQVTKFKTNNLALLVRGDPVTKLT